MSINAEISFYSSALDKPPTKGITVKEFVEIIRAEKHSAGVARVRAAATEDEKRKTKLLLPAVQLSGLVTTGERAKAIQQGRFQHSGCLQLDVDSDGLGIYTPEQAKALLGGDRHVLSAFITPSGEGAKALFKIKPCLTEEEHKTAWYAAEKYISDTYGLKIDSQTKDPGRLCFLSSDKDCTWQPFAEEFVLPDGIGGKSGKLLSKHQNDALTKPKESKLENQALIKPDKAATQVAKQVGQKIVPVEQDRLVIRSKAFPEPPRHGIHAWTMTAAWYCRLQGSMTEAEAITKLESYSGSLRRSYQENEVRDAVTKVYASPIPASIFDIPEATTEKLDLAKYTMTDSGNAERVHAYAGSNFKYVSESGRWLLWDGKRWSPDTNGGMVRLFISVMKLLGKSAFECGDPDRAKSITKHALNSMDSSKVTAGLQMLKSIIGVSISVNDLDADHWMIGTTEGMIDLKTGKTTTPDRSKLITKIIGTDYDASAACPTWEKFLKTVTNGDTELIDFLQCAMGYTLTGSNREQCLFFLHGSGCNGKGVFSETIKKLMGDYGQAAPESLFTVDRNRSATNDIARLAGCRMAIAAELEEGTSFAESRIKGLTGGDTIPARFLNKEFFDFIPTHHFWISGNHKPRITGSDDGIWRRIRLIPFIVRITAEEKDLDLADKLAKELPGILNWALDGCLRWQQEGLKTPSCVINATDGYRAEEDIIGDFLTECTEEKLGEQTTISCLYECYQNWAQKGGLKYPLSARALNKKFDDRGMIRLLSNGGRYWRGISII